MNSIFKDEVSIVLSGEAGQGIQTIEKLLTKILKDEGFNVFATKEYMSRIRGGSNSTEIRVGTKPVRSHKHKIDVLLPLTKKSVEHLDDRVTEDTVVICQQSELNVEQGKVVDVPIFDMAKDIGGKIYSNIVALGFVLGLFGIKEDNIPKHMKKFFGSKSEDIINNNIKATEEGFEKAKKYYENEEIKIEIKNNEKVENNLLFNGSEAVALGCLAGGCDSIFSYPMTPGSGVLIAMAGFSEKFDDLLVEQAEDEIAAINMAVGGWYAGSRSMITTSGGGFALMGEGISLAAMLETPVVAHIAQRPGPATGLPTRTAQEDLNLIMYAGHGEFPRAIFAPGKLEDGFSVAQNSFNLADKYQVPVFILTDQSFVDSYYNVEEFDLSEVKIEKQFVKTDKDYKRYALTEDGISPRGIPGYGEGIVGVDSDEHDEAGHITEDLDLRNKMNEKRLSKLNALRENALEPELYGNENYKKILVSWGSNYYVAKEALDNLDNDSIALLHFTQVYPIADKANEYLEKAEEIIVMENNATGQFEKIMQLETGFKADHKLLKYNGMPFAVDELTDELKKLI